MATPVTMPVLGLTMEEGTVAEWLKAEGDSVAKDEPLLTVEMDKGTVEVPSPTSGVLLRIAVQTGTTVPVKTLIAEIGAPGEVLTPSGGPGDLPPMQATARTVPTPSSRPGDLPPVEAAPREVAIASTASVSAVVGGTSSGVEPVVRTGGASAAGGRLFASPRARLRARETSVDLASVHGSGPHGRIVEADVLAAATTTRVRMTPLARRMAEEHGVALGDLRGSGPGGRVTQDDVLRAREMADVQPLSRIRRITAERMAASAQATARVTLFLDADFTEAVRFRAQLEPEFARLGVARLPWDAIVARAAALALAEHRRVLAQWAEGRQLHTPADINVGVAVTLEPEGLVVPVLRNADLRSLRELASELLRLVDRARAGRLTPAEMQGGGFSITNLGGYGIDGFTPILNPPETAILGVGRIAEKAIVLDGAIVARSMCTLSLSFDHRVVDGAPAAAFLARLAQLLERPYALLGI